MPSRKQLIFALSMLIFAILTGLGTLWFTQVRDDRVTEGGTALIGGPFALTDQDGKRVTEKDFLGKYMLVFFGFTYCPDVCPSELQVMSAALDELGPDADRIQPVFITIDPARDTPSVMKEYVANFHPRLRGLTGSESDIAQVAGVFRVYYAKQTGKDTGADYQMDHSTILYLMGSDGKFLKHFSYGTGQKELVAGLRKAMSQ